MCKSKGLAQSSRVTKDESKCTTLSYAVSSKFSSAVHYQPDKVFSIVESAEEYIDWLLEDKQEKIKTGKDKDITSKTACEVLDEMLDQYRLHSLKLDYAGISGRQDRRKSRMSLDVADGCDSVWQGSSGSSRNLSECEEEGNACGMRGGNGYCTSVSGESS